MKHAKPSCWILLGVVVGVVSTVAARPAQAQRQAAPGRIVRTSVGHLGGNELVFLKDPRNGGCWLAIEANSIVALAVAPTHSCD